ncbi:MAG: hypothetical protein RL701_5330 [Pseudomonadota bacterium]
MPLSSSLLAQHAASDAVAFGEGGVRTVAELLRAAAVVADALPELREPAARALALIAIRRDRFVWAAALLGAWARGYTVGIPPADVTREDFLGLAQHAAVGAVLHDTLSSAALRVDQLLSEQPSTRELTPAELAREGAVVFLARRTDRAGLAPDGPSILRSTLIAEALALAASCELPERRPYVCTVAFEVRLGFTLGLFWPLLSGGSFWRASADPGNETTALQAWANELTAARAPRPIVISVPAHIRQLLRDPSRPLEHARQLVSGVAALPAAAVSRLTTFPKLHVFDTCAEEAATDATTQLELEEQVAWFDGVEDAALLRLDNTTAAYLAVVTALHDHAAVEDLIARHVPALRTQLARLLVLTPSAQPPAGAASFTGGRRGMARSAAGSHDRASLLRLFELGADGTALAFELAIGASTSALEPQGRQVFPVHVPANYGYFAGHFPGHPILPGAAQLSELVLPCVRRARPALGRLKRMTRLKFQERILPDDHIEVLLDFGADPANIDFTLRRAATICAAGRLTFEAQVQSEQAAVESAP